MKNYFLLIFCCSLLFLMTSCEPKQSISVNPDDITLNYQNSKQTKWTSNAELSNWHSEYLNDEANKTFTMEDGSKRAYEYVDFKFEDIKHLVWLMQTSVNKSFIKNEKPELGLRVYYTKDHEGKGHNTVTLAPIFRDKDGKNKLFDPRAKENLSGTDSLLSWKINYNKVKSADPKGLYMFWFQGDDGGTNLNHGSGCRPNCGE